jgi:predicted DNA-binding transcriptional regulator YafY
MRASRLLTILMTLQVRGLVTARALADACEVTLRTIYRDIDALSAAGVPVYSERGPQGGYRLLDGYKTRVNGLSGQEAETLFLSGLPGPAAELGLGAAMATAQLKLLNALPPELRRNAERLRSRFHLDAPAWFNSGDQAPHLPAIAQAVWTQKPLRIGYRSWTREMGEQVEPLGLVLKSGHWYLVAALGGKPRTFRVSRILRLEVLDSAFERPADFDLGAYWKASSASFEAGMSKGEAVIRVSPHGFEMLSWSSFAQAAARSASAPDRDGWRQVVLPIESLAQACADVMRLGADAEVLAPRELCERLVETAATILETYSAVVSGRAKAGAH